LSGIFILYNNFAFLLSMKKTIFIIIIFTAAFLALYEQSKAKPNVIVMVIAIVIFMLGLMQLMSKIPDKNQDKNEDDV
jgi:hypothetical protein